MLDEMIWWNASRFAVILENVVYSNFIIFPFGLCRQKPGLGIKNDRKLTCSMSLWATAYLGYEIPILVKTDDLCSYKTIFKH